MVVSEATVVEQMMTTAESLHTECLVEATWVVVLEQAAVIPLMKNSESLQTEGCLVESLEQVPVTLQMKATENLQTEVEAIQVLILERVAVIKQIMAATVSLQTECLMEAICGAPLKQAVVTQLMKSVEAECLEDAICLEQVAVTPQTEATESLQSKPEAMQVMVIEQVLILLHMKDTVSLLTEEYIMEAI